MAENLDLQINDLKFRAATSDKFPYARATAPFRKEQFDSAPTVGDQSLSGWWTRGQLSFHKGAGVKYYEVLEGETILNRFQDCEKADPWTPGEVTIKRDGLGEYLGGLATPSDLRCDKPGTVARHGDYLYVISGPGVWPEDSVQHGRVARVGKASTVPSNLNTLHASEWAQTVTVDDEGDKLYVGVGNTIEVFSLPANSTTVSTVLWTNNNSGVMSEDRFNSIFWAKGRIWAADSGGRWYHLDPAGGTIPAGGGSQRFWNSGIDKSTPIFSPFWAFAESPGAIYIAHGQYVYSTTLDLSGGTPAVATPVTVADLGPGEWVRSLLTHRSILAINTASHFRIAEMATDGSLTVGPLAHKWPATNYTCSMAAVDDVVYFAGPRLNNNESPSVYMAHMTELLEPLLPAIAPHAYSPLDPYGADTYDAALVAGKAYDDTLFFVGRGATKGLFVTDYETRHSTATLTTGFHRFGTLDGKHFQEVLVRSAGTGSITVTRVDADGTETPLAVAKSSPAVYSMNAADQSAVFDIGLTAPVERIALKFTLSRDPADHYSGPTLLGYQIKALPSPVRQRLIKWPLLIQDTYRDRYGVTHGKRDGAWPAWAALEALEEADALVSFTDHRTGETGNAYIESLELQMDTPSKGASTGFGGVGYLTLRRVS